MVSTISRATCRFAGRSSALAIAVLLFLGCNKNDSIEISTIPEITLLGISHDTIHQYQDVLLIRISYTDGDGDLGFEETNQYALFVRDIRLEEFDGFYLGPIAPPGEMIPIKGDLNIEFPTLFVFGNNDSEITRFEIKMIDRKGNESNLLTTENIIISKN